MWQKLRKFGLEYCDLPTMMWNISFMLRALTLNVDSRNKNHISILSYTSTILAMVCYSYVYQISMVWFVFNRCRQTGDKLAAIVVFSLGISSEIGVIKLLFMKIYEKTVRKIVDGYIACDALVEPGSRFAKNLLKTLRVVKRRALIFWCVIIINGVVYVVKALLLPGRHMMEDAFVFYGLEPMLDSPNYEIGFIINTAAIYVTCYLPANVTAFFIITTGYTEAQMLALSEELNNLWEDAQKYYKISINENNVHHSRDAVILKSKELNKYVKSKLELIVKSHTTNINLLRQIEDVFRGAIAVEFMLLVIGIIAELLGGLEKTWIELPFALVLVGMDCLSGQRVTDASVVFERAVYNCKWDNFDVANRRIVLLMLQTAQKNMVLSAGGVTTLSFVTLMAVIKSTFSAYTTLRSTM